jgi:hypothetical protein
MTSEELSFSMPKAENGDSLRQLSERKIKKETQKILDATEIGIEYNQQKMNIPVKSSLTLKLLNNLAPVPISVKNWSRKVRKGRPPENISGQEA